MDDFVGADRFQWPDAQLEIANRVRAVLPARVRESYLAEPNARLEVRRPDAARLIEVDPTEAAQSGRILDAVRATFPGCAVTLTGGVVYHLALNDVLAHFDDEADGALLDALLLLDRSLAEQGHTHYAVALARVSG